MPDRALGACAGRARVVALADAADEDFVGLVEGSALQEHIAQHARRDGKSLSYRVRLRGFDAVCRMVGQGVGVAVVPRAAAATGVRPASGVWI